MTDRTDTTGVAWPIITRGWTLEEMRDHVVKERLRFREADDAWIRQRAELGAMLDAEIGVSAP